MRPQPLENPFKKLTFIIDCLPLDRLRSYWIILFATGIMLLMLGTRVLLNHHSQQIQQHLASVTNSMKELNQAIADNRERMTFPKHQQELVSQNSVVNRLLTLPKYLFIMSSLALNNRHLLLEGRLMPHRSPEELVTLLSHLHAIKNTHIKRLTPLNHPADSDSPEHGAKISIEITL